MYDKVKCGVPPDAIDDRMRTVQEHNVLAAISRREYRDGYAIGQVLKRLNTNVDSGQLRTILDGLRTANKYKGELVQVRYLQLRVWSPWETPPIEVMRCIDAMNVEYRMNRFGFLRLMQLREVIKALHAKPVRAL